MFPKLNGAVLYPPRNKNLFDRCKKFEITVPRSNRTIKTAIENFAKAVSRTSDKQPAPKAKSTEDDRKKWLIFPVVPSVPASGPRCFYFIVLSVKGLSYSNSSRGAFPQSTVKKYNFFRPNRQINLDKDRNRLNLIARRLLSSNRLSFNLPTTKSFRRHTCGTWRESGLTDDAARHLDL
jgi:hypothetical protein